MKDLVLQNNSETGDYFGTTQKESEAIHSSTFNGRN